MVPNHIVPGALPKKLGKTLTENGQQKRPPSKKKGGLFADDYVWAGELFRR